MNRTLFIAIPTMTVLALVAAWSIHVPPSSLDATYLSQAPSVEARVKRHDAPGATAADSTDVISANASPFAAIKARFTDRGDEKLHAEFQQLVQLYQSKDISQEKRRQIADSARLLLRSAQGRKLMIDTILSTAEPAWAEAAYKLVRDADLRDISLLEGLVQQDTRQSHVMSSRILDLLADANAHSEDRYSPVIDRYLAQLARDPNADLRRTSATGRIWYLARHQPNNLISLSGYLKDTSPAVREEMYSLIESKIENNATQAVVGFAPALSAAVSADDPTMTAAERARIAAMLRLLNSR